MGIIMGIFIHGCLSENGIFTPIAGISDVSFHKASDKTWASESHSIHCPTKTVVWDCDMRTHHPNVPAELIFFDRHGTARPRTCTPILSHSPHESCIVHEFHTVWFPQSDYFDLLLNYLDFGFVCHDEGHSSTTSFTFLQASTQAQWFSSGNWSLQWPFSALVCVGLCVCVCVCFFDGAIPIHIHRYP